MKKLKNLLKKQGFTSKVLGFRFYVLGEKNKANAFTLVELIIVIAIIAVLAVAAFMMLTKWLGKSRDSKRISDIGTIKRALEVSYTDTDDGVNMYATPSEYEMVRDPDTNEMWYLGVFGTDTIKEMSSLQKVPQDPGSQIEYKYALTLNKKEFQVGAMLEDGDEVSFAANVMAEDMTAYVDGNYDGYVSYPLDGGGTMILKTPSLLLYSGTTLETLTGDNGNFMVSGESEGEVVTLKNIEVTEGTTPSQIADALGIEEGEADNLLEKEVGVSSSSSGPTPINGDCGTANKAYTYADTSYGIDTFCTAGTANPETPAFPGEGATITWDCEGENGGTTSNCSSTRTSTPINGVCGSANGVATLTAPSTNLCTSGNATAVTTNANNFTWSCQGVNEGTDISCSATRQYTVSGSFGTNANGATINVCGTNVTATSSGTFSTTRNYGSVCNNITATSSGYSCSTTTNGPASLTANVTNIAGSCVVLSYPNAYSGTRNSCETTTVTVGPHKIASCNVGATSAVVSSSNSYGLLFQFGNAKGYSSSVTPLRTGVNTNSCAPNNCLTNYIRPLDRSPWYLSNNDLWGSTSCPSTTNPTLDCKLKSRGPCPVGFHIPTLAEFQDVMSIIGGTTSTFVNSVLQIPPAGMIAWEGGNVGNRGSSVSYWTSTFNAVGTTYDTAKGISFAYKTTTPTNIWGPVVELKDVNYALPVRCFKN